MIRAVAFVLGYVAATVCLRALPPVAFGLAGDAASPAGTLPAVAAGLAFLLTLAGSGLGGAAARIIAHDAPLAFFASIAGTFLFVQVLRLFVGVRYERPLAGGVLPESGGLQAGLILAGTVGLVVGAMLVKPGRGSDSRAPRNRS